MKKTNINCAEKYISQNWPDNVSIIENTDENNMTEVMAKDYSGCVWNWSRDIFEGIKSAIITDHLSEINSDQPIVHVPKEEGKISEDFALKMIAMVANKEKIKDLE